MRYSALLGSILAAVIGSTGFSQIVSPIERGVAFPMPAGMREAPRGGRSSQRAVRAVHTQAHTGAGGPGMHRRWKRVRASGRAL